MEVKTKVSFFVRGYAQTKGSTKAFMRPGMRFPVITNDNPKTKEWAKTIQVVAQMSAPDITELWSGPIALKLIFYMKKPASYPKSRDLWHIKKPDLDKLVRAVGDALTGVIYTEDSHVVEIVTAKHYSNLPGVWIEVKHLEGQDVDKQEGGCG